MKVGDLLVGKSVIGDTGFKVGPSLGIRVDGFVDGLIDGRLVVVIKESVTIKVGSLLIRGSDVDESLGFGVGTSLLGSSVIGIRVGTSVSFLDVGTGVGVTVDLDVGDNVNSGMVVEGEYVGLYVGIYVGAAVTTSSGGLKVVNVPVGRPVSVVTELRLGLSLGIAEIGFVEGFSVGRLVEATKDAVVIKVGSLLVGCSDVGESLGFGLGASLLGPSVVGL